MSIRGWIKSVFIQRRETMAEMMYAGVRHEYVSSGYPVVPRCFFTDDGRLITPGSKTVQYEPFLHN